MVYEPKTKIKDLHVGTYTEAFNSPVSKNTDHFLTIRFSEFSD